MRQPSSRRRASIGAPEWAEALAGALMLLVSSVLPQTEPPTPEANARIIPPPADDSGASAGEDDRPEGRGDPPSEQREDAATPRSDSDFDPGAVPRLSLDRAGAGLGRVAVTATGLERRGFESPYATESFDGAVLTSEKAFRTLPEALREVPGVLVQKTAYGQGSPYIRGFTGFRTLLLVDGIRLNNAVFRDGPNQYWSTVDPLTIDRLEVVKGPSSVLYGSDAIGGTVNAITRGREPASRDSGLDGLRWSRRVYYRFASAEDSHVARAEAGGAYGSRLGLLGGLSWKDFGDLSAGRDVGALRRTGYEELDGDAKTILRLARGLDLVLAFQSVTQYDVPRTHSTIYSRSFRGTTIGSDRLRELDQERRLGYAQVHWRPEDIVWLSRLTWSTSYQSQEEEELRVLGDRRRRRQGFDDGTFGTWVRLESPSPLGTWTYGVEYYRDEVDSFFREWNADGTVRSVRPRGPVADDASYDLLGAYVQDSVRPLERLEVVLGGRFQYARARAGDVDPDPEDATDFASLDEDYTGAVGSLRLLYDLLDGWNLFGGVSQGFRAPNLSDLTRFDVARSGEVEVPAPDLDPERFISFEAGSKLRLEELGVQVHGSYHYTLIDDMIIRFPTGETIDGDPVVTKDNVGDGFVHGFELGLAWSFYEGFTAFGDVAWIEGRVDTFVDGREESEPLSRLQPATGRLGLRWDSPASRYWMEASVTIAAEQDRLSPRDEADTQRIPPGGTPGYAVYTLRGGAEVVEGLRLFAAVENLTDVDYRVHGSGQNEPGTNAVLGFDWTF